MITAQQKTALKYIIVMVLVLLLVTFVWAYLATRDTVSLQNIIRTDSGVSTEVRKAAILELVGKGSEKLTDIERNEIINAIALNRINTFGFTEEERDLIFNVINN